MTHLLLTHRLARRFRIVTALAALGVVACGTQGEFEGSSEDVAVSSAKWATDPNPGPKSKSPETNLSAYPKRAAGQSTNPSQEKQALAQARTAVDVVTSEALPDGTTRISIYEPAPDFTPERLADLLRGQGKDHVQLVKHEPSREATLGPGDCAYGQARSISCPVAFWTNNGFGNPLVRFNDHSGPTWPTDNAVYKWNQVANIDSAYLWDSCPFLAGARCVDVYSGNYGEGWVGLFTYSQMSNGAFYEQGANIQLNEYYAPQGFTRNMVVTHEMGHALGLGHNTWNGDVMYATVHMREDIGGENQVLLESIYSIDR